MTNEFLFVYMTASSIDEARRIGRILVEKRLAACVNLLPTMHSIYWWENQIEEAKECVLIAKTRKELFAALNQCVKELHSYNTPCVIGLPILLGDEKYLNWIKEETNDK